MGLTKKLSSFSFLNICAGESKLVTRGVFQVLSIHLRNRVQDVTELKARVNELEANRIT